MPQWILLTIGSKDTWHLKQKSTPAIFQQFYRQYQKL